MAKVKLAPFLLEAHGKLGDVVLKQSRNGETIISRRPTKPKKTESERQAMRSRMEAAHAYAHAAMADPEKKKHYESEAKKVKSKAYWMALSDYLTENK